MINKAMTYLIVKDFDASVEFYKNLLERDTVAINMNRFAIFQINEMELAILNGLFDSLNSDKVITDGKYDKIYDDTVSIANAGNSGKTVINLYSDNLNSEYERINNLKIGSDITEIKYINAGIPYYYFCLKDPDGNTIEITGDYCNNS